MTRAFAIVAAWAWIAVAAEMVVGREIALAAIGIFPTAFLLCGGLR